MQSYTHYFYQKKRMQSFAKHFSFTYDKKASGSIKEPLVMYE